MDFHRMFSLASTKKIFFVNIFFVVTKKDFSSTYVSNKSWTWTECIYLFERVSLKTLLDTQKTGDKSALKLTH